MVRIFFCFLDIYCKTRKMPIKSERDITKLILEHFREAKYKTINENDSIELSGDALKSEENRFREIISPRVQFTGFKIYPRANNVIFGGVFQNLGGLEWQFSLENSDGLYITANNIQVNDEVISVIQKLKGYYETWADEWSDKLATEYKTI
jgi:hypothetical protein